MLILQPYANFTIIVGAGLVPARGKGQAFGFPSGWEDAPCLLGMYKIGLCGFWVGILRILPRRGFVNLGIFLPRPRAGTRPAPTGCVVFLFEMIPYV